MVEDSHSPYIHRFSISMPGCYMPEVRTLALAQLDWTVIRPHVCFFDCLTLYSAVTEMQLHSCRFKNASQLRRLINALPRLATLELSAIDGSTLCDGPTTTVSRPTFKVNQNLRHIHLSNPPKRVGTRALTDHRVAKGNVFAFCAQYASVSLLSLDVGFFESFAILLQLLHHLPLLSHLLVHASSTTGSVGWQGLEFVHAGVGALHLSDLCLEMISTKIALDLMALVATPETCSKLRFLTVRHGDSTGPVGQLRQSVRDTLRQAGAALRGFMLEWTVSGRGSFALLPIHRNTDVSSDSYIWDLHFTPNSSLEDVDVILRLPPSAHTIERTLISMVSSIASPCLSTFRVQVYLDIMDAGPLNGDDVSQDGESGAVDNVDDFHAILDALHFRDLPHDSVHIGIDARGSMHQAAIELIDLVKSRLDKLFAPWFARDVLRVSYEPHPDLRTAKAS